MPKSKYLARIALAAALGAALLPAQAEESARVPTQQACMYLADYALVARALAEESSLSTEQADSILNRIYLISHPLITDVEGRLRGLARDDRRPAQQFSMEFLKQCVTREGDVTAFLEPYL
jgi:hypothetical protein